jgi:hypothetical protein
MPKRMLRSTTLFELQQIRRTTQKHYLAVHCGTRCRTNPHISSDSGRQLETPSESDAPRSVPRTDSVFHTHLGRSAMSETVYYDRV